MLARLRAGAIAGFWLALAACGVGGTGGPDLAIILADKPAETLGAYGLFADQSGAELAPGVRAYELINPLFSDHADKDRALFVPPGEMADWHERDAFAFPVGTVLIKSFGYAETGKIETRLLIHKHGGWKAYPYVWNDDHSEARYRPIGARRQVEVNGPDGEGLEFTYAVPNQNQCKTCHQAGDALVPIGPKARNLAEDTVAEWQSAGWLRGVPAAFDAVPSIALEASSPAARARAYLDINCGHCHKSDGAASNSGLWLEWDEQSAVRLGIDKHPTAAGRGSGALTRVIEPGVPDDSILIFRMETSDPGIAMPELGRSLIHDEGIELVRNWIADMEND